MDNTKTTKLNFISGIIAIFISTLCGFLIPRIIIRVFGSEVNGLISSINQYIGYASLLEGGITGIIIAKLYKPLLENDNRQLSIIVNTANRFYRKISIAVAVYCILISFLFPFFFSKGFDKNYVFLLSVIISVQYVIQYSFALTLNTIISADGKIFVISLTQSLINILNVISLFFIARFYPSIHAYKLIGSLLYIAQPIVYYIYVKRNYIIPKTKEYDNSLLNNKWDGISLNIATFIRYSTDIAVLTIFTDFKVVSVYSIYYLVISGLEALITVITNSITPIMGKKYATGNKEMINRFFDKYETLMMFLLFSIFTISFVLITPFVQIYTLNVSDANYYQPLFGYLLVLSELAFLIKRPHEDLCTIAEKFKEMKIPAYIEAISNIVISIVFVKKIGLSGVAVGTLLAMLIRIVLQSKMTADILSRDNTIFYKKSIFFMISSFFSAFLLQRTLKFDLSILNWIIMASISSSLILLINYLLLRFVLKRTFKDLTEIMR